MENWQLTLVILASVFVGALIPLLVMGAITLYRAGRAIGEIGGQLKRTLVQVEVISERVEVLTRGFKGGEASIADLLTSVGHLANGLESNMKTINTISTIIASIGTAIAAMMSARSPVDATNQPPLSETADGSESSPPPSPSSAPPETDMHAH